MSSSCRRITTNQHPFRRQVSLLGPASTTGLFALRSCSSSIYSVDRTNFEKQNSIEQQFLPGKRTRQKRVSGRTSLEPENVLKTVKKGFCKTKNVNITFPSYHLEGSRNAEANNTGANVNLEIVSVVKKRAQHPKGYDETKIDKVNGERLRRASKVGDDRFNLKIFLAQSISRQNSNVTDSSESSEEAETEKASEFKEAVNDVGENLKSRSVLVPAVQQQQRTQICALSRRARFKACRMIEPNTSENPVFSLASTLSLTVERRPPLVRAMSAPIRSHDENNKNLLTNKRKIRRRKLTNRTPNFEAVNGCTVVESKSIDNRENIVNRSQEKGSKKTISRTRSAIGCDVVTLVSLISSEGSDSEKEESLITIDTNRLKRPPLLRKSGKSVSFQEDEIEDFANSPKEFSQTIRRASVAPLAIRLRANRPPTAPPSSVFIYSDITMSATRRSSSKEDLNTPNSTQRCSKENIPENCNASNESQYPEYVRSLKERECWKLFQKMSNKGVSVSYDTILRGMLTPTELRLLQKQKELEEARKIKELEDVKENKETSKAEI